MSANLHVIVGLGATGLSCARYLTQMGIPIAVTDSRQSPPQLADFQQAFPDVPVALGKFDEVLLAKANTIVLSPGVALHEPLIAEQIKRGVNVVGDIELFARVVKVPVIAITGTNAKSTVTTLVGKMMAAAGYDVQVGGNLGIPALDLLNHVAQLIVLELSSFQLETTYSLKPSVASILNITPDHMDRYPTFTDYQKAKQRVYQHCQVAVCNRDDQLTDCAVNHKFYFTLNTPSSHEFGLMKHHHQTYLAYEQTPLMPINELPVQGKHYQANALAALAIGYGFGLPFDPMLSVLKTFAGLPHRCELVRERHEVRWYNDSKGTNVGATQAAIEGLGSEISGKLILIAGGVGKNADFNPLVPVIENYARHVILIGEAALEIAKALGDHVMVSHALNMQEAVQLAANLAKPKDSVLLSPACASFDMFKNFEHRGDVFRELVKKLN